MTLVKNIFWLQLMLRRPDWEVLEIIKFAREIEQVL